MSTSPLPLIKIFFKNLLKKTLFLGLFSGYLWFLYSSVHPVIPDSKEPLVFYSNGLHDDLKLVLLRVLRKAKTSISLQIYGLSDPEIIALLQKKQAEGVDVKVFYHKAASRSLPPTLCAYPIHSNGLMHRKILIIDDSLVFLGTANFTAQSLKMHDNLICGLWHPEIAKFLRDCLQNSESFSIEQTKITSYLLPDFHDEALKKMIQCIDEAKETIQIAMFTLTHPDLVTKLITATQNGVRVTLAIDRYTYQGASKKMVNTLQEAGVNLLIHRGAQLFHHKWVLIDRKMLVLGSANWTKAAFTKNLDSILFLENLPKKHQKKLQRLWRRIASSCEKK